jgi:hypothetical protein
LQKIALLALGFVALASLCHAEPRWCNVTGKDPSNKFIYPPIARAARVSGVVLLQMIYIPNGKVQKIEPISGPRILSDILARQLMDWTVKTDATGDELCETLVIATFELADSYPSTLEGTWAGIGPGTLHLSAETSPLPIAMVNSDPAPLRGWNLFRHELTSKLNRVFAPQPESR